MSLLVMTKLKLVLVKVAKARKRQRYVEPSATNLPTNKSWKLEKLSTFLMPTSHQLSISEI